MPASASHPQAVVLSGGAMPLLDPRSQPAVQQARQTRVCSCYSCCLCPLQVLVGMDVCVYVTHSIPFLFPHPRQSHCYLRGVLSLSPQLQEWLSVLLASFVGLSPRAPASSARSNLPPTPPL